MATNFEREKRTYVSIRLNRKEKNLNTFPQTLLNQHPIPKLVTNGLGLCV